MGAHLARRYVTDPSGEPDPQRMPTFPPDYGFPARPAGSGREPPNPGVPGGGFGLLVLCLGSALVSARKSPEDTREPA